MKESAITLDSCFSFVHNTEKKDIFNLNKLSYFFDLPFEKYMTEQEYYKYLHKISKNYNYNPNFDTFDINDKYKFIYNMYKNIYARYPEISNSQIILQSEQEEFDRLITPNQVTIKNIIREYLPDAHILIKIGVYGPKIYLYTNDNSDKLCKYLDTFYFGKIINKYLVIV